MHMQTIENIFQVPELKESHEPKYSNIQALKGLEDLWLQEKEDEFNLAKSIENQPSKLFKR